MDKMKQPSIDSPDVLYKRLQELERENDRLRSLLLTDELTGLYNKRFFYIQLEIETARTRRTGQPCTLVSMDLDDFKSINDTLGHDAGDHVLHHLGGIILKNIRPTDFACRFGGDEFFIIMPASNLIDSIGVAKRIQHSIATPDSIRHHDISKHLFASIGLAMYEPHSPMTVDDFFKEADRELYEAKKAGKNQISYGCVRKVEMSAVSEAEKAALSQIIPNFQ